MSDLSTQPLSLHFSYPPTDSISKLLHMPRITVQVACWICLYTLTYKKKLWCKQIEDALYICLEHSASQLGCVWVSCEKHSAVCMVTYCTPSLNVQYVSSGKRYISYWTFRMTLCCCTVCIQGYGRKAWSSQSYVQQEGACWIKWTLIIPLIWSPRSWRVTHM